MRKINIKTFQRNVYKEIKSLPFIVTKDSEDYLIVSSAKDLDKIVNALKPNPVTSAINAFQNYPLVRTSGGKLENIGIDRAEDSDKTIVTGKCEAPNTNCKFIGKEYKVTFMTDEGEKKKDVFLCAIHVRKTKDSGTEVQEIS